MVRRAETPEEAQGEIVVVLEGEEKKLQYADFDLSYDSTDQEVLEAISPVILEEHGVNLEEDDSYTVKSIESSKTKYIFPKSTAG